MAKKFTPTEYVQLALVELLNQLLPGVMVSLPVEENNIGGELLNILSKGLYTNPLDAIREYVQNAIDANATLVQIQVTGNSVWIMDYGDGMSRDQLLQAREFGISRKSIYANVGFRGIGIYSGFDLCEQLVVTTKQKDDEYEHFLEFRFGEMRRKLEIARQDPKRPVVPLSHLLKEHTYYRYEKSNRIEDSFTFIQMESLSDNHIHRLSDVERMKSYILHNLPIRFNDSFPYAKEIEDSLSKYVDGYKSARVVLNIDGSDQVVVEKPNIPNLDSPEKGYIYNAKGREIAYYWACLVSGSEGLPSQGYKDHAGLIYKVKGFTIGDRLRLQEFFTRPQVYGWWTGEIYVISTDVIPTSARDDFEAGPSKDALETAVRELLNGSTPPKSKGPFSLQKTALNAQASRHADKEVQKARERIMDLDPLVLSGNYDEFILFAELDVMIKKINQQKGKATDQKGAEALLRKANSLQAKVRKQMDEPKSIADRKKEAAKHAMSKHQEGKANNKGEEADGNGEETGPREREEPKTDPEGEEPGKAEGEPLVITLRRVVEQLGWTLQDEMDQLITVVSEVLLDNLPSAMHDRVLSDIEVRLTDILEEG